jgi:hypothetical protein
LHIYQAVGKEATESPCNQSGAPKEREAVLELVALVVHGHEIRTARHKAHLKHTQKEAAGDQTAIGVHKALAHARDAPEEGKCGDPCRRGELAEEDVAGDLEEDVRHEEDL